MDTTDTFRFLQSEVSRLRDENRQLKDELAIAQSSVHALCSLQELLERMTPEQDVIDLLNDILASALMVVGASDGSLLLLDDDTQELVFAVVLGEARSRLKGFRLPRGKGIAGWVAASARPAVVRDVKADSRFYPAIDETIGFNTRTLACVPLVADQRTLGVIEAINKNSDREFTSQDMELLQLVALLASLAIRRAEELTEAA
jgi:GAF domain-containing protein